MRSKALLCGRVIVDLACPLRRDRAVLRWIEARLARHRAAVAAEFDAWADRRYQRQLLRAADSLHVDHGGG